MENKLKSGEYLFSGKTSLSSVIDILKNGEFYYRKIVIPECTTVETVIEIINKNKFLVGKLDGLLNEGSVFPDTYFFLRGEEKEKIVKRMQNKMENVVNKIWHNQSKILKTKLDLIKLASIIEAETIKAEEKFIVSSVFHNRLKKNMKLQSDPTILYAKNLFSEEKTRKIFKFDLRNDNAWNTYTRKGLPITPICNPGEIALNAAMNPIETNYLYFVADGKKGHRFSATLKQHQENVIIWRKKLTEKNENK